MQAIAATVCSRLPICVGLLTVFSGSRQSFAVCRHSYTGPSQSPAAERSCAVHMRHPEDGSVSVGFMFLLCMM